MVFHKANFIFEQSLIESARGGTEVQRLYYNNSIEYQHFRGEMELSYKKRTVVDVISTLKKLVDRQEDNEIRAIYGSGSFHLNIQYAKFQMDSVKWHFLDAKKQRYKVSLFWQHIQTMKQEFKNPQKSEKKANEKQRKRMETSQMVKESERWEKNNNRWSIFFFNFIFQPQVPYVLFFRSLAPRIVQRCQWNCGINLKPSDNENYLVVKSYGSTTYTVNGDFLVENENWSKLCAFR